MNISDVRIGARYRVADGLFQGFTGIAQVATDLHDGKREELQYVQLQALGDDKWLLSINPSKLEPVEAAPTGCDLCRNVVWGDMDCSVCTVNTYTLGVDANYCPKCGRRLE